MTVIGITPCPRLPDYVESIRRAGGDPRVLSLDGPPSLDGLDGVLLTGGSDVDPMHYHEPRHPSTHEPDAARDAYELALARMALSAGTPLLAVCRGVQVLNVAAGGTLVQDIPTQLSNPLTHQIESPLFAIAHEVWVAPESKLAAMMRDELVDGEVLQVNSRHHQAIKQLAEGFKVTATAPDGVIEAIERPDMKFCMGVQWHPENFWRTGEFRSLFEGFVTASSTTT